MIRLFLFLVPLLLSVLILECALRNIPNDYGYKDSYLKDNAKDIEVLVLGSSHAYRGIIAENLSFNSFNVAYISQSLDLDVGLFEKYKQQLDNLKCLVINISYPSLFGKLSASKEDWRLKNYNIYYDFNETSNPKNYSEVLSNTFDVNKTKIEEYYVKHKQSVSCTKYGDGYIESRKERANSAKFAAIRHTNLASPYFKAHKESIKALINYTAQKGIQVVITTPPARVDYRSLLDSKQLLLMETFLDSITNNSTTVFRLNSLKSGLFVKGDFLDADHLNKSGAIKFTEQLNKLLNQIEHRTKESIQ